MTVHPQMPAAPIWQPSRARIEAARITHYTQWLARRQQRSFASYDELWRWSTSDLEGFWRSVWEYFDVRTSQPFDVVLDGKGMPGARWFPGVRINYVEQVLRHADPTRPAIVQGDESGRLTTLSWRELERQVASVAACLRRLGVVPGDRVAALLPNRIETVVAFLACASVGAVWSLCSPEMGLASIVDRFSQIAPQTLIACDGYDYGGKQYDKRQMVDDLRKQLTSVRDVIRVPAPGGDLANLHREVLGEDLSWHDVLKDPSELQIEPVPFDHPLWIVYSSGTTGMPKAIVHGHGGVLLTMSVALAFHNDLGPRDRYHWYSSSGWVMWNCQVGGLLVGSTICIYDGNPGFRDLYSLWRFAARAKATFFGAGAAFHASCLKAGIEPAAQLDLRCLRSVGSTGSPLSPECYAWVYRCVGEDVWLAPMSGGTDIAGPFVAGNPTLPVYIGEMQCRVLGAAVHAFDAAGSPVVGEVGELVCVQPLPSMPLLFWNDPNQRRYRESYFDTYPGVWRHGDWMQITPRGGAIIYGRSDATINRHGIRMGTSELYRAVEANPEVLDSLVVDLEYLGRPSYMPIFVVLRSGATLTDELQARIRAGIRAAVSPRLVPDEIFTVPEIPRTLSGKKLEVPIKRLLLGHSLQQVVDPDAMANPHSLQWFAQFAAASGRHT